jgi:hypothetical protein
MRAPALLLVLLGACSSGELPTEEHQIGAFEYQMPTQWEAKARSEGGRHVVEWMPNENDDKESITIIQSEPLPAMAKAGRDVILGHLAEAQGGLAGAFGAPTLTTSKRGFKVARIEGSFTPANRTQPYQRTHAVVVAGDRLIHVLYTAEHATSNRDVLSTVVNSLHRKGA